MNLDKSINNLSERLNKLYPDTTSSSSNNCDDGVSYWKGKRIISLNQWLKVEQDYTLETALQYFPDGFLSLVFPFNMDSISDPLANTQEEGFTVAVLDESIFVQDALVRMKIWVPKGIRPVVTITGSHQKP